MALAFPGSSSSKIKLNMTLVLTIPAWTFFERIQEDDVKQASIIMASFAYNTAMRDEKLPRKPLDGEIIRVDETKPAVAPAAESATGVKND